MAEKAGDPGGVPPNGWHLLKTLPPWRRRLGMATVVYWVVINAILGVGQVTESWLIDLLARWLIPISIMCLCLGVVGLRQVPSVMRNVNARSRARAAETPRVPWPYGRGESSSDGTESPG